MQLGIAYVSDKAITIVAQHGVHSVHAEEYSKWSLSVMVKMLKTKQHKVSDG